MRHRQRCVLATIALGVLSTASLHAHDIWLAPDSGLIPPGGTLTVRQFVGIELESQEELPLIRRSTGRFELITDRGTEDLFKALPSEKERPVVQPVLTRVMNEQGIVLVAMDHDFIYGDWSEKDFAAYLEHEEFRPGEIPWTAGKRTVERERYQRSLKCLSAVGSPAGTVYERPIGQHLEILLGENPYQSKIGGPMHVRILFEGRPLADKLVMALHRQGNGPVEKFRARTDAKGIATFRLSAPGQWLIRLVHMRACADIPGSDCEDYDWETDWASLTFVREE